jgi:hypothetical protein
MCQVLPLYCTTRPPSHTRLNVGSSPTPFAPWLTNPYVASRGHLRQTQANFAALPGLEPWTFGICEIVERHNCRMATAPMLVSPFAQPHSNTRVKKEGHIFSRVRKAVSSRVRPVRVLVMVRLHGFVSLPMVRVWLFVCSCSCSCTTPSGPTATGRLRVPPPSPSREGAATHIAVPLRDNREQSTTLLWPKQVCIGASDLPFSFGVQVRAKVCSC